MVVDPFDAILGRLDGVHEREVEHLVRGVARQGAQHGEGFTPSYAQRGAHQASCEYNAHRPPVLRPYTALPCYSTYQVDREDKVYQAVDEEEWVGPRCLCGWWR